MIVQRLRELGGGPPAAAPRKRSWQELSSSAGAGLFVTEFLVLLVLWQFLVGTLEVVNPLFLPPPLATVEGFGELIVSGDLAANVGVSLTAWTVGFGVAAAAGIAIGLLVGSSVPADRLTSPILWTIYATPWLAYRPLSKAWFGFGLTPIIFLVVIASVFPILFNTSAGVRTVGKSVVSAGRVYGAGRLTLYRKIVLPSTVPYVIAGLRQAAVMATIALIVAEMTGPSKGMGALLIFKANTYETAQSFAAIIVVVIWSLVTSQLLRLLGQRLAPWTVQGAR